MAGRTPPKREYPFPQADRPDRVLQVLELVCRGPVDEVGVAAAFDIDPRQGAYYTAAAAYLGFLRNSGGLWRPTKEGLDLNAMADEAERQRVVGRKVLALPVFSEAARHLAEFGELPPHDEIAAWIRADERGALNEATTNRRARTVESWVGSVAAHTPELIGELRPAAAVAIRA